MKDFFPYGGHLGHVTSIILTICHFHVPKNLTYKIWIKNGLVVSENSKFIFHMLMALGQGQEMTLTFNTHILS